LPGRFPAKSAPSPAHAGNVLAVLRQIAEADGDALNQFDAFLNVKYPEPSLYISAKPSPVKLTFAPHVFTVPQFVVESDLIALMMPFASQFAAVHQAIKEACQSTRFRCLRADDIWEETTIIQDIFNLLLRAKVVVVDVLAYHADAKGYSALRSQLAAKLAQVTL
jgi:hypothetical protein